MIATVLNMLCVCCWQYFEYHVVFEHSFRYIRLENVRILILQDYQNDNPDVVQASYRYGIRIECQI